MAWMMSCKSPCSVQDCRHEATGKDKKFSRSVLNRNTYENVGFWLSHSDLFFFQKLLELKNITIADFQ